MMFAETDEEGVHDSRIARNFGKRVSATPATTGQER